MSKKQINRAVAKPFVKWAGGKGSIISQLVEYLPQDFEKQQNVTYIELPDIPFPGIRPDLSSWTDTPLPLLTNDFVT